MNATQPRPSDGWKPAGKRPKTFSLKSKQSRQKLPFTTNPYYKTLLHGLSIGYRRNASKPTFFGRLYDGTPHSYSETWEADDNNPANGISVVSYDQAVIKILAWHKKRIAENSGEVIVDDAYTVKQ